MPDREHDPPRPPEGRSRKEAGPEREPGQPKGRCERRDEKRHELALPAGLGGRGDVLAWAGRCRREWLGRQAPRRRGAGRAPALSASGVRRFPGGRRRPRRREGGSLRGGVGGRGHARGTGAAGCGGRGRRGRGERDRCMWWRFVGSRQGHRGNLYADRRKHGRDGVAHDLGRSRCGRRSRGDRRRRRNCCRSGLRRRSGSLRLGRGRHGGRSHRERLVDGRPHRRASPGRDGVDLRESRLDLGLRVPEPRRARGTGQTRARQRAADGCGQHTCPT